MRNAILWLLVAVLLIAGAVWWIINDTDPSDNDSNTATPTNAPSAIETASPTPEEDLDVEIDAEVQDARAYTIEEVAKHDSEEDCWFVINDQVYDVTEFIPNHPGGEIIALSCGTDATEAFETQGGQGTHSDRAADVSENFIIGELAQ